MVTFNSARHLQARLSSQAALELPFVFLFGSALTKPHKTFPHGVPDTEGMVQLVQQHVQKYVQPNLPEVAQDFTTELKQRQDWTEKYQFAFSFLSSTAGQNTVNSLIRLAVAKAHTTFSKATCSESDCKQLEQNYNDWHISPWLTALGQLLSKPPKNFKRQVFTTNFDPLIELAVHKAGGTTFHTTLDKEGTYLGHDGFGCHVVYLHGRWSKGDTLHTLGQLAQPRAHLTASLKQLFKEVTVVVLGYSGWNDVFQQAFMSVINDPTATIDVAWAFFEKDEQTICAKNQKLLQIMQPKIDSGRIQLYKDVDLTTLLPAVKGALFPEPAVPDNSATLADDLSPTAQSLYYFLTGLQLSGNDLDRLGKLLPEVARQFNREMAAETRFACLHRWFNEGDSASRCKETLIAVRRLFADRITHQMASKLVAQHTVP